MMKNNKLDKQVVATFTRQLGLILDSDIPVNSGLDIIKSKTKHERLTVIITEIQKEMKNGYSLSETISKFTDDFSSFVLSMIKLGEKSGSLASVLNQISDTLEKEMEIKAKVKAALSYPIILSVLMMAVIMLLVVKILPMFSDILSSLGGEMPWFTELMISFSNFVSSNIVIFTIIIIVLVALYVIYKKTDKGSYNLDKLKFHMPVQKDIVSALVAARFSRNLSILIKSGTSFSIALEMLKPVINNRYMSSKIETAIVDLREGESISSVVEKFNIFPGVMIKLFAVAEMTGHMDKMLEKVADEMEKEADLKLENIATVIEPMLIIGLSILVGIILISVILPIVNILNSIG